MIRRLYGVHDSLKGKYAAGNLTAFTFFQLTVCQLLHGLSRSVALLHTIFSDISIIDCLVEVPFPLFSNSHTTPLLRSEAIDQMSSLVNM